MKERNRLELTVVPIALIVAAARWIGGYSLFGFRTPFWDLGLLPILASMVIGLSHLKGSRRRFLIGFESSGVVAAVAYVASCTGPARWSPISALLPFQTGFWLDPEMTSGRVTLSPWKVALDAVFLALLPLVPALIGGWLASTRITLRRAMALVAVVALVLGVGSAYLRRVQHYDDMGQYHRCRIVGVLVGSIGGDGRMRFVPRGSDRNGRPLSDARRRLDVWHEAMSRRYWEAARYP